MKYLFSRGIPLIASAAAVAASFWQWKQPLAYPYPLAAFFVVFLFCAVVIAWRRLGWQDAIERLAPASFAIAAVGFGFLMADTPVERWFLTFLLSIVTFLVLELLHLLARDPGHYPVNGLSRLNIALVPVAAFFLASTLNGLLVFVRLPRWIPMIMLTAAGAIFYLWTSHPSADRRHRRRWTWFGALVGAQIGLLSLLLPVHMAVHGALAACLLAFPLRVRRYAYQPVPSARFAWAESFGGLILFVLLMASTSWS